MSGGEQVPGPDEESGERRFRLRVAEQHADGAPPPADPHGAAVVEALERTRADLAAAPSPPLPPHVLAGIDRALAAERTGAHGADPDTGHPSGDRLTADADVDHDRRHHRPVGLARDGTSAPGDGDPPATRADVVRDRRQQRPADRRASRRRRAALLAAALVLVVLGLAAGVTAALDRSPAPIASPDRATAPVVNRADPAAALRLGLGGTDTAVPADRAGCLAAHGVAPGTLPLGQRIVVVDGRPAVLFVLPTGVAGRFRVLVVGEACAAGVPSTVAEGVVGR